MFSPNYINDLGAFVVRMPSTYALILLDIEPFTAGADIKFRLEPKQYEDSKSKQKIDTGDYWAHVLIHPTSLVPEADAIAFIKSQFIRVNLNPVNIDFSTDRKMGAGNNKVRVGFLPADNFDPRNLKTMAKMTAPDGKIWYVRISKGAAERFHVCLRCLGISSARVAFNIQCECSSTPGTNQGTAAQRASARASYQSRALKRAREEADPWA